MGNLNVLRKFLIAHKDIKSSLSAAAVQDRSARNSLLLCGTGHRREAVLSHQEELSATVWQVILNNV